MANFKRKKSRYKYRCSRCNSARDATLHGDLNQKDLRNNQKVKEEMKKLKRFMYKDN
jgi:hypothetical protein